MYLLLKGPPGEGLPARDTADDHLPGVPGAPGQKGDKVGTVLLITTVLLLSPPIKRSELGEIMRLAVLSLCLSVCLCIR